MAYTVKQLAKLSGVSVRTLHFYDEVGLLKPAYYGTDNNYRYYEEEQLLLLQQILFYRELGFPLADIKKIIGSSGFDKMEALHSHKVILEHNIKQTQKLIDTIDKTTSYLRCETMMLDKEMFDGFDLKIQKLHLYEEYLVTKGITTYAEINKSWNNVKHWKKDDWNNYKRNSEALNKKFIQAVQKNLKPDAKEVQDLVANHYEMIKIFWTPNKDSYIGLGKLYCEDTGFSRYYEQDLAVFLAAAMKIFAERNLS